MKNFFKSVGRLFMDSQGNASSKRFVGVLCGVSLCITLYVNSYSHGDIRPSDTLVNAVAMLAFGCLGLTSTEKIFGKKSEVKKEEETQETV
jgi:ABC-type transport system involved in cytochrome c biogenesis permease subunit